MKYLLKNEEHKILLRNIENKDAELLMELNNDSEISHYVVGNPRTVTLQEQMQWMENIKTEVNCKRFIVEHNAIPVGTVIISNIDWSNLTASVGIKLHRTAQGKGIGKQCITMVVKYCFETLGLYCLTAQVLTYNKASLALFRSCGFINEGILRSRVIKENKRCDLAIFSMIRDEFT